MALLHSNRELEWDVKMKVLGTERAVKESLLESVIVMMMSSICRRVNFDVRKRFCSFEDQGQKKERLVKQ